MQKADNQLEANVFWFINHFILIHMQAKVLGRHKFKERYQYLRLNTNKQKPESGKQIGDPEHSRFLSFIFRKPFIFVKILGMES